MSAASSVIVMANARTSANTASKPVVKQRNPVDILANNDAMLHHPAKKMNRVRTKC